jgi:hypothetical protein
MIGCGKSPKLRSNDSLQLLLALRTACNTRSPQRLDRIAAKAEQEFQAGKVAEAEMQAFRAIIAEARAGRWEKAELACLQFQRDQVR